jgi:DGQHR domain-containing protein
MSGVKEEYTNDKEISVVSSIFKKSGIDCIQKVDISTKENKTDIDVVGVHKNVVTLVECVGKEDLGPKLKKTITDFGEVIKNFDKVVSTIRSNFRNFYKNNKAGLNSQNRIFKKLLVTFNKETKNDVDETNLMLCNKHEIYLWTREEKYYYDKVSDCTYDHCKYEILDYLNVKPGDIEHTEEPVVLTYLAYGSKVKNDLYILNFIVPIKTLLARSSINRLQNSSTETGYQRLLDKAKLKKMRGYLLKKPSMYPNNIICVLNDKSCITNIGSEISNNVKLSERDEAKTVNVKNMIKKNLFLAELPDTHNVFEIIDGQHRLFSFAQTKYHLFEKIKDNKEKIKLRRDDKKIEELSKIYNLVVTAIYSKNNEWGNPGKLFLEINTTQTRIKPEDVIDLVEKFYKNSPIADANRLLRKLNENGILKNKIKIKFWQEDRIKRTSLISYSGLKNIFEKDTKSFKIFREAHKKQRKIKDYGDFCFILINSYIRSIYKLVQQKYPKTSAEIGEDLTLKKHYLFSAVFIGALIRLLRHFISKNDCEFGVLKKINKALEKGENNKDIINKNIENKKLQEVFHGGLQIIVNKYDFTKDEFTKQEDWGPNKWAKMESDMFYLIRRNRHPKFGDETLISKKHRQTSG